MGSMFEQMMKNDGIEIDLRHRGAEENQDDSKEWLEYYFIENYEDCHKLVKPLQRDHPEILPIIASELKVRDFDDETDLNAAIGRLTRDEREALCSKLQELFK